MPCGGDGHTMCIFLQCVRCYSMCRVLFIRNGWKCGFTWLLLLYTVCTFHGCLYHHSYPPLSTAVAPAHPLVRVTLPPAGHNTHDHVNTPTNIHLECALGMARVYCCTAAVQNTPTPTSATPTHHVRCLVELAPGALQGVPSGCALMAEVAVKGKVNAQRDAMEHVWEYVCNHAGHTQADLQGVIGWCLLPRWCFFFLW